MVSTRHNTRFFQATLLGVLLTASAGHAQNTPPATDPVYANVSLPVATRVRDLILRMTLEEKTSQLVSVAPAVPRLQIPGYNYWTEGLHGIGMDGVATVFPQSIGYAASWNTSARCPGTKWPNFIRTLPTSLKLQDEIVRWNAWREMKVWKGGLRHEC